MSGQLQEYDSARIRVPVLVVGAGPAGLTTALALAHSGVRSLVVSRHATLAHTPRAHITNQRTLEILADLGVENEVRAAGDLLEDMPYNVFQYTLAGPEVARTTAWGAGVKDLARYRAASRHRGLNLPQHLLEPVLAEAAVATGLVDLRFSHEVVSLDQDETGVDAVVVDRHSGQELKIRSDYLVGADGANSRVLSQIGLAVRGERNLATNCYAWIKADLSRFVAHRPGVLYWPVDPAHRSFTLVKPWDEWTVGWAFREAPLSPDEVIEGIRSSVGDPRLDVEIKSIAQWSINHAAADTYSRGRVFGAGDAVHQHPPTNGLGSNTSIADGYNLAWKLHLALGGAAGPGLLASYGMERAPVGRQVVDRAFQSVQEVFSIAEVISLTADMDAEEKRTAIRSIQDPTDEGARKRQALADAMALMEYNFNAHGVELGYRDHGAAILESLDAVGRPGELEPGTTDDIVYVACTAPGEHLPHVFVERNGRSLSTVDLVGMAGSR